MSLVLSELRLPAAILTLNRPEKHNALNAALLQEFDAKLNELEINPEVRGVVITGNDKAFSAGADLGGALQANSPLDTHRLLRDFARVNSTIETMSKPVVAAINGYCLTGGLEVALACDFRIAGTGSTFGITSSKIGSVAGAGGTQRLPRLVGPQWAKEILFSGKFYDADFALRIGLIAEIVPPSKVLEAAVEKIKAYAANAPLSIWLAKMAVNTGTQMDLEPALEFERRLTSYLFTTADRTEGMSAMLEKRPPIFKGR